MASSSRRDSNESSVAKRRNLSSCTATGAVLSSCSTNATNNYSDVDFHERNADAIVAVPLLVSRLDDLTDDVLLEIFLCLPAKTLHRLKTVSKRWLSLISAPSFAHSYNLVHPVNKILFFKFVYVDTDTIGQVFGLPLLHDDMNKVSSSMSGLLPLLSFDFIPALKPGHYDDMNKVSPSMSGLLPPFSFESTPGLKPGHYDDYHPVFSRSEGVIETLLLDMNMKGDCAGLVLIQAAFKDRTYGKPYYGNLPYYIYYYIYYVCNPITKQWVKLPLISTRDLAGFTCYYLQQEGKRGEKMARIWGNTITPGNIIKQSANYDPNKIEYTVVSVGRDEQEDVFIIRVFSSTQETPEWKIFRVPFPHGYKWRSTSGIHRVLFSNGKFHWSGVTCIVAYDPFDKPHQCDIIPLPPQDFPKIGGSNLFTTYEGCIRLGTPCYTGRCAVWELADYANKLWVKKYHLNVDPLLPIGLHSFVVGSGTGEKAYVVSEEPKDSIMIFDMKNASLQHVYTYPNRPDNGYYDTDYAMWYIESYISSSWPTPVPLQKWQ